MSAKHVPGPCPGCGAAMENTGAPIWEDYCPSEDCTWHRDEFWRGVTKIAKEMEAKKRLCDAAPTMLAALKHADAAMEKEGFSELSTVRYPVIEAIAKAEAQP